MGNARGRWQRTESGGVERRGREERKLKDEEVNNGQHVHALAPGDQKLFHQLHLICALGRAALQEGATACTGRWMLHTHTHTSNGSQITAFTASHKGEPPEHTQRWHCPHVLFLRRA